MRSKENITITVVTPSYNQGEFISDTIESVLRQEGSFCIDYIIMDGGSRDKTTEIISEYERHLQNKSEVTIREDSSFYRRTDVNDPIIEYPKISFRWFSQKDNGQVDALKKGFAIACGDIYCWLNSDDYFIGNDVLKRVVDYFTVQDELDLLTADGMIVDRDGREMGLHHVDRINFKELLFLDYHILQPSTFFRKELYDPAMLDEKYVCAFDADFFIHLIHNNVRYLKTDDVFAAFRMYPEIKTNALSRNRYREQMKIARRYSNNFLYWTLSLVYRYFQIVLRPKYEGRALYDKYFNHLYKFSYKIITGRSGR